VPCELSRGVLLQVLNAVGVVPDLVLLEKAIQLITSLEAQEQASLIGKQNTGSISFDGEGFQRFTCCVRVLGQVVGKLDGDLHGKRVAGW
jgi:hypothetical protein